MVAGVVRVISPDLTMIAPARPAKQLDLHSPLTDLTSHFAFYYFYHTILRSNEDFLN